MRVREPEHNISMHRELSFSLYISLHFRSTLKELEDTERPPRRKPVPNVSHHRCPPTPVHCAATECFILAVSRAPTLATTEQRNLVLGPFSPVNFTADSMLHDPPINLLISFTHLEPEFSFTQTLSSNDILNCRNKPTQLHLFHRPLDSSLAETI